MASECDEQAVLRFVMERGGRVEQMELIDHFESIWKNDPSVETMDRETLRSLVDAVASVTIGNGVKFVCVETDDDRVGSLKRVDDAGAGRDGDGVGADGGPPSGTPSPAVDFKETSEDHVAGSHGAQSSGNKVKMRERRRRESAPAIGTELEATHHPAQVRGGRRVSRASQRAMLAGGLSEDSAWEGLDAAGDLSTPKGSRRNFIELMMSSSPQVRRSMIHRSSRLRDSVRSDGDSASLLSSSATDEDCASVTLDPLEHEWMLCASEGQWESLQCLLAVEPSLVSKRDFVTGFTCLHWAAKQGKADLLGQLLGFARESSVSVDVNTRSSAGYTPLHLAAMHGHIQVLRVLLSDWEAEPEARDYSGRQAIHYLPRPLAANLHQEGLVTSPGAESDTENAESGEGGVAGRGWRLPRVLQSNLNPLRLLNPPPQSEGAEGGGRGKAGMQRKSSLGCLNARLHRGRRRAQIIHSPSFRETGEVSRDDPASSPVRTRPLSSLFG